MNCNLAISTYSFGRFGAGPEGRDIPSLESMIDRSAELGLQGLEIIGNHLTNLDLDTTEYRYSLKQYLASRGMSAVSVSAHHNFVQPDPAVRQQHIDTLNHWVDAAAEIGAPYVRAFGGRWGTISNFNAFMDANGEEPPIDGYTEDDAFSWSIDAFKESAEYAGSRGVTLLLENHWGLTGTAAGTLRIFDGVDSPWLKLVLDTGNFIQEPDQYAEMAKILPHVALLHAKTYHGGSIYFGDYALDYTRIGKLLQDVDFKGFLSIEFEGLAIPADGIPAAVTQLRTELAAV